MNQRTFHCDRCKLDMDRDRNAAINIMRGGLGVEAVRMENGRRRR